MFTPEVSFHPDCTGLKLSRLNPKFKSQSDVDEYATWLLEAMHAAVRLEEGELAV